MTHLNPRARLDSSSAKLSPTHYKQRYTALIPQQLYLTYRFRAVGGAWYEAITVDSLLTDTPNNGRLPNNGRCSMY